MTFVAAGFIVSTNGLSNGLKIASGDNKACQTREGTRCGGDTWDPEYEGKNTIQSDEIASLSVLRAVFFTDEKID
jgi:hypothetical protein